MPASAIAVLAVGHMNLHPVAAAVFVGPPVVINIEFHADCFLIAIQPLSGAITPHWAVQVNIYLRPNGA